MSEAEQSVIGAVLLDNDAWWRVCGLCSAADFASPDHQAIWRTMDRVSAEGFPLDPVTLSEQDESLDLAYLARLSINTPSAKNAEAYARLVHSAAVTRQARAIFAEGLNGAELSDVISRLESLGSAGSDMTLAEAVAEGIQAAACADGSGVPLGIPCLDRWVHLHGGKLVIVAARPSVGKTALVWQGLLHAAKHHPVGMISLEMGPDELGLRAISHKADIDSLALTRGRPEAVERARHVQLDLPVRLDFRSSSLNEIVSRITQWHYRHNIELVAVDYLQLMDADGENRNAELGRITRTMKKLARRLGIPIILLCQLNRALEKTGRKPMLVDLRDSGEIEQDADIVIALHSELTEQPARHVEVGILKNRSGRVGWLTERVMFHGSNQTFREVYAA